MIFSSCIYKMNKNYMYNLKEKVMYVLHYDVLRMDGTYFS